MTNFTWLSLLINVYSACDLQKVMSFLPFINIIAMSMQWTYILLWMSHDILKHINKWSKMLLNKKRWRLNCMQQCRMLMWACNANWASKKGTQTSFTLPRKCCFFLVLCSFIFNYCTAAVFPFPFFVDLVDHVMCQSNSLLFFGLVDMAWMHLLSR